MATDTDESSSGDERDSSAAEGSEDTEERSSDEMSQEELAERDRQAKEEQYAESKRKVGPFVLAASIGIGVIGLTLLYLGSTSQENHPLLQNGLMVLGVINLGLTLAVFVRANWSRTSILVAMPINFIAVLLGFTEISTAKYLVFVLSIVVIALMFRQPVLDEYDAPKE